MSNTWHPKNWEEVCKRNAGRRKLHMRNRKARANRIIRVLNVMSAIPELRETAYGWLTLAAETTKMSKATASRDFALARRINAQFVRLFGRTFEPKTDQIKWCWNWSHYGFRTRESLQAGYRKPVGNFPFNTRVNATEETYQGLGPNSWRRTLTTRAPTTDLLSHLRLLARIR
jgi:hypothetical protein